MASLACLGDWEAGSLVRRRYVQLKLRRGDLGTGQFSSSFHSQPFLHKLTHAHPSHMENKCTCAREKQGRVPSVHRPETLGNGESFKQVHLGLFLAQQPIHQKTSCPSHLPPLHHGGVGTRPLLYRLPLGEWQKETPSSHCLSHRTISPSRCVVSSVSSPPGVSSSLLAGTPLSIVLSGP